MLHYNFLKEIIIDFFLQLKHSPSIFVNNPFLFLSNNVSQPNIQNNTLYFICMFSIFYVQLFHIQGGEKTFKAKENCWRQSRKEALEGAFLHQDFASNSMTNCPGAKNDFYIFRWLNKIKGRINFVTCRNYVKFQLQCLSHTGFVCS